MPVRTRTILTTLICAAITLWGLATIGGCADDADRAIERTADGRRIVEVWYPFGGEFGRSLHELAAEFERTHPDIKIKLSFAANNLTSSQKLFLAIAAGEAPDVTLVDGQQLSEWAARGALEDITEYCARTGVTGDDFWLPRWKESTFRGRVHALPWGADPNFALAWNKQLFREAGLDPDRPPRTIEELDEYNARLTKKDANGNITQIGLLPWPFGMDNSIFTWAYAWGGELYREPTPSDPGDFGTVTANDPRVVAALEWLASYVHRYDVRKLRAFRDGFVGEANDPFYLGSQAMAMLHVTQLKWLHRYAPTMEYGLAPLPAPPDGVYPHGWIGGWSMGIPRGAKNVDDAFTFMRWACATPEGSLASATLMGQFPAHRHSPYFDEIQDDPDLMVFYEILSNSKHVRTLMPVQGYLMDLLRRGADEVLYGGRDPQVVLDEVTQRAQARLEHVMTRVAREHDEPTDGQDRLTAPLAGRIGGE